MVNMSTPMATKSVAFFPEKLKSFVNRSANSGRPITIAILRMSYNQ
jgi:hypothetical protein